MTPTITPFEQSLEAALVASKNGLLSIDQRNKAFMSFRNQGIPSKHTQGWRFTNLTPLTTQKFSLPEKLNHTTLEHAKTLLEKDPIANTPWTTIHPQYQIFVNGMPCAKLSSSPTATLSTQPRLIQTLLSSRPHPFTAINTAFMMDGPIISIPQNTHASPIFIIHIVTDHNAVMIHPRTYITLEPHSSACILEHWIGSETSTMINAVTQIHLEHGASLNYIKIQHTNHNAFHFANHYAEIGENAHFTATSLASSSGSAESSLARIEFDIQLQKGAECALNGLQTVFHGHLEHHTNIVHLQPYGQSAQTFRNIVHDTATALFHGRIQVAPHAQKTNAMQSCKNLPLSPAAIATVLPELEIYADDVKCSHGATIGKLDEEALFYLRSRGIEEVSARKLLTAAFANEIIHTLPLSELMTPCEKLMGGVE